MVRLHSLAASGGVLDAIERQDDPERAAAVSGFRFFGLNAVDDIGRRLAERLLTPEEAETELEADTRYNAVVDDDGVLRRAFEARYEVDAGQFAPVE